MCDVFVQNSSFILQDPDGKMELRCWKKCMWCLFTLTELKLNTDSISTTTEGSVHLQQPTSDLESGASHQLSWSKPSDDLLVKSFQCVFCVLQWPKLHQTLSYISVCTAFETKHSGRTHLSEQLDYMYRNAKTENVIQWRFHSREQVSSEVFSFADPQKCQSTDLFGFLYNLLVIYSTV